MSIRYVTATIEGTIIYLEELSDGSWAVISEAPSYPGVYPITVTVTADNGIITIVGCDDEKLGEILRLIVTGEPRHQLINYLPPFLQDAAESKALLKSEGIEFDRLEDSAQIVLDNMFILTATESRIEEWEKKLKIIPAGAWAQRKTYLLSILHGVGKLNEAKIKAIVAAFTEGDARISFENSTLKVQILSPTVGDIFLFNDIARSLKSKIPAHIGLTVQKYYSTWRDVKTNYTSWMDIAAMDNWKALKDYIAP
ncbi:MAG TPA: putative phage tail protein [Syntrophomonas sp.]|nr:putative phage tail protein [Syntrophomonas sp.]